MRGNLKIFSVIALIAAATYSYSWIASNGKREIAQAFLIEVSSGGYVSARERLNSTLSQERTEAKFASHFSETVPFTSVSLNLVGRKDRYRTMNLTGLAQTGTGCVSTVYVSFDVWFEYFGGDGIENFSIEPLCFN